MKRFAILLLAMCAAAAFGAETLDVNGSFSAVKPGAKLPSGWLWNQGPNPVGTYEMIQVDGKNAVKFVGEKNMLSAVYLKYFPVKPGEKYELSVNVTGTTAGKGSVNVGMHLWSDKDYLVGNYANGTKLTGKPMTVKRVITIPETVVRKAKDGTDTKIAPTRMRVLFLLWSPGEATFTDFTAKKLD